VDLEWAQVLSEGWAAPLTGFMTERQYLQCQHFGYLLTGTSQPVNQSIPIVLPVQTTDKDRLEGEAAVTLRFNGQSVAIIRCPEFYEHRKEERCCRQFGSCDTTHPYIKVST